MRIRTRYPLGSPRACRGAPQRLPDRPAFFRTYTSRLLVCCLSHSVGLAGGGLPPFVTLSRKAGTGTWKSRGCGAMPASTPLAACGCWQSTSARVLSARALFARRGKDHQGPLARVRLAPIGGPAIGVFLAGMERASPIQFCDRPFLPTAGHIAPDLHLPVAPVLAAAQAPGRAVGCRTCRGSRFVAVTGLP